MLFGQTKKIESLRFYGILAALAFISNWIWEMVQMFAFDIKPADSRLEVFYFCTLAAAIDLLVTIGIYGLLKRVKVTNQVLFYLLAALLGASCAVLFEWFALRLELWRYNPLMPIVPIVRVGLLPLAQLTTLVPLAIGLTDKLAPRTRRAGL